MLAKLHRIPLLEKLVVHCANILSKLTFNVQIKGVVSKITQILALERHHLNSIFHISFGLGVGVYLTGKSTIQSDVYLVALIR